MKNLFALVSGLIFGLGLFISGMVNPAKIQNFLDLFGTWDPSLAFVMGGAIAVTLATEVASRCGLADTAAWPQGLCATV